MTAILTIFQPFFFQSKVREAIHLIQHFFVFRRGCIYHSIFMNGSHTYWLHIYITALALTFSNINKLGRLLYGLRLKFQFGSLVILFLLLFKQLLLECQWLALRIVSVQVILEGFSVGYQVFYTFWFLHIWIFLNFWLIVLNRRLHYNFFILRPELSRNISSIAYRALLNVLKMLSLKI